VILVDTNILLRSHPSDPRYLMLSGALAKLRVDRELLCIAPQNLVEYWVVATRPLENRGLGMQLAASVAEMQRLRKSFHVLEGLPGVADAWEKLVGKYLVLGKQAHDANLVATMLVHGVKRILTFNRADFKRFPGINVMNPAEA
jgi:predicted nucleic acid-binding protein